MKLTEGDFVYIEELREVGEVVEVIDDPWQVRVRARGETTDWYNPSDLKPLSPVEVMTVDTAMKVVAQAIDRYNDSYQAVADDDGTIIYSNSARAVLRDLNYVPLILMINKYRATIDAMHQQIQDLERKHGQA